LLVLANTSLVALIMPDEFSAIVIKILTVNTHKGFTFFNRHFILHELREAIRATGADIVFLQEVIGARRHSGKRPLRWPDTSHYEFLADTIWTDFAYGRNAVYPHGDHGNALLSKFPIIHSKNYDVSVGRHERRGLLHCVIQLPGLAKVVHAVCVHLGLREMQRRIQLDSLCRMISEEIPADSPLLIAGDFNDWRLKAQRRLMHSTKVREVFFDTQGNVARTFPARYPVLRLDRIYVCNARKYRALPLSTRPWTHLSDHAPLAAEISL
jgi:endonuclease/exonuclease/phosphatase family metal-dependent hydrolase